MMMTTQRSVINLARWQKRRVVMFTLSATVIWALHGPAGIALLELPTLPLSVLGAAIGIFASFRTNASYERWWEGRKLWGRLVNSSRHWCSQALHYVGPGDPDLAAALVRRQIAYVHTLRCALRQQDVLADPDVAAWLDDHDRTSLDGSTNANHALLDRQLELLAAARTAGTIDGHQLERFDNTMHELLNIQGGCERIKGTPLPKGYGFIVDLLIDYFGMLFPLALVHDLGVLAIPVNVLVGMSFTLISEAGRVLEDPFNEFWNALPLSALARKIERNLRERLGDTDLPPDLVPDENGVLM